MTDPFVAPSWLQGMHSQTLWSYLVQGAPSPSLRRERVTTPDGDFVDLDWMDGPADAPLVIALHGLEGSSSGPYMRRLMGRIQARGWRGVVLHSRGCSGEDNRFAQAYHAGHVADIRALLPTLVGAGSPVFMVGYSLGGAQLMRFLGEFPDEVPAGVRAAFTVSSPMTLEVGSESLKHGFNRAYTLKFLWTLRAKAALKARLFPEHAECARRAGRAWSLEAFDAAWTAPVHGFDSVSDYYARAAAGPFLRNVRVPSRLLMARDDTIVPPESLREEQVAGAAAVDVLWTEGGGHVGFVCQGRPHWLEDEILGWFEAHGNPPTR